MPFELPDNLHPDCAPIAWLLGTWRGNGHGDYPTIDAFQFGQECIFTHDGRPFFHYMSRAWIVDEQGTKVRDAAIETGFLRPQADGTLEWLLTHNTGFAEVYHGTADGPKIEVSTDAVVRTETAKEYVGGHRMYGLVEGAVLGGPRAGHRVDEGESAPGDLERLLGAGQQVHGARSAAVPHQHRHEGVLDLGEELRAGPGVDDRVGHDLGHAEERGLDGVLVHAPLLETAPQEPPGHARGAG